MKVLNIHGYHGNSENSAYLKLKELKFEVISPQIDYDRENPDEIFTRLHSIIEEEKPNVIVGTSLGGFYSAVLCVETGVKCVLVNPCLMPFLHLPRLGYSGDICRYIGYFGKLEKINLGNVSTIIGGMDDVINTHDVTKNVLNNERFEIFSQGLHSGATLPLKEFFGRVIK